ncbi:MAG: MCP four helix bundle domain-containing protein [Desulfovibrio sp.]|jgi:hypothetical protein|nr:MCP four helix bundle domain-containing protein [Desulfovibrio sp.]
METAPKKPLSLSGLPLALFVLLVAVAGGALWLTGSRQSLDKVYATTVRKAQIVADMRTDLYAAAEAEKSAVLADTDQSSVNFANQARASVDKVTAELKAFQGLAESSQEQELAKRFEEAFAEYRKVDEEVLGLAVQNTNLKAFALSFGQAAAALADMEKSLRPLLDGAADKPARQAQRALAEALRIQSLHAAHIMEKTDPRMDALEKDMARADKAVRTALAALGKDGASALAVYERYWKLNGEIVGLSRQNTNVRSFTLSLERKTKALAACDEALRVLEKNIRERMATKATR